MVCNRRNYTEWRKETKGLRRVNALNFENKMKTLTDRKKADKKKDEEERDAVHGSAQLSSSRYMPLELTLHSHAPLELLVQRGRRANEQMEEWMSGVYDGRAGVETDVTKGKDGEGALLGH